MMIILFSTQIFIVMMLVILILLQKTGSDGLSGLSGGGNSLMSGKAVSNILTKITVFLAIAFMVNSLILAKYTIDNSNVAKKIIQSVPNIKKNNSPVVPIVK